LNLKWYAVPLLSDMAMKIGGIVYPFAPFNGFIWGRKLAPATLADQSRYNVLPDVAEALLGLDVALRIGRFGGIGPWWN
jgi:nitric-oxide synthase